MDSGKEKTVVITIDGPAGAGKSTMARLLARRAGCVYLDTGAMYRAAALKARRQGIDFNSPRDIKRLIGETRIDVDFQGQEMKVFCDGEDVTDLIRDPSLGPVLASVAVNPEIRAWLVSRQREVSVGRHIIVDGRDAGTVIYPEADVKFYLNARPQERARRRFEELKAKGLDVNEEEILKEILQRDHSDRTRSTGPLKKADDAVEVDSTGLTIEETVEHMKDIIDEKKLWIRD